MASTQKTNHHVRKALNWSGKQSKDADICALNHACFDRDTAKKKGQRSNFPRRALDGVADHTFSVGGRGPTQANTRTCWGGTLAHGSTHRSTLITPVRAASPFNEVRQRASSESQDSVLFWASFFAVVTRRATFVTQLLLLLSCSNSRLFSVPNGLRLILFALPWSAAPSPHPESQSFNTRCCFVSSTTCSSSLSTKRTTPKNTGTRQ